MPLLLIEDDSLSVSSLFLTSLLHPIPTQQDLTAVTEETFEENLKSWSNKGSIQESS